MAVVGHNITLGVPITLDAADEFTPPCGAGEASATVEITLQFSGTWSGTVTFQRGMKVSGSWVWDPAMAVPRTTGTAASTSTGGASAVEHWTMEAGGGAVRVYATAVSAGTVAVTFGLADG